MATIPRYLSSGLKKVKDPKNDAHLYDTLLHLNPSQMSLVREHIAQKGGLGASALYGHQTIAEPFKDPEHRRVAAAICDLPQHQFARVAVAHKEIGGSLRSKFKKGKNLFKKLGNHFVQNIDTYANIGTGIAQMTGLISDDTGEAIRGVAEGFAGDDEEVPSPNPSPEKGAGLQIY